MPSSARISASELCKTEEGRRAVQSAIDDYAPYLPHFFGAAGSKNNELYRKFALKERKNEEMRADFLERARAVTESLGLRFAGPPDLTRGPGPGRPW